MKIDDVRSLLKARLSDMANPRDILKAPELKELMGHIRELPKEDRADFGAKVNALRGELIEAVEEAEKTKQQATIKPLDTVERCVVVPDRPEFLSVEQASLHPLTVEIQRIVDVFTRMGFVCEESRQIDDDYHMFSSLNFPPNHPARDGYDTFRTEEGYIPPAHTTAMEKPSIVGWQS